MYDWRRTASSPAKAPKVFFQGPDKGIVRGDCRTKPEVGPRKHLKADEANPLKGVTKWHK
jgi:hypothetical protein